MRWKIRDKKSPKIGDERTITKFAWLPIKIDNYKVWLEAYDSFQKYEEVSEVIDMTEPEIIVRKWVEFKRKTIDFYYM